MDALKHAGQHYEKQAGAILKQKELVEENRVTADVEKKDRIDAEKYDL